jgi:hypothetical protein
MCWSVSWLAAHRAGRRPLAAESGADQGIEEQAKHPPRSASGQAPGHRRDRRTHTPTELVVTFQADYYGSVRNVAAPPSWSGW